MKPIELLLIAFALSMLVTIILMISIRPSELSQWTTVGIAFGATFIVSLVGIAMSVLAFKPNAQELAEIEKINEAEEKK